jgi:hypothetical protein
MLGDADQRTHTTTTMETTNNYLDPTQPERIAASSWVRTAVIHRRRRRIDGKPVGA